MQKFGSIYEVDREQWISKKNIHWPHSTKLRGQLDEPAELIIQSDSHPGAEAPEGVAALQSAASLGSIGWWEVEAMAAGARREVEVFCWVDPVGSVGAARSRLQDKVPALHRDETSAETETTIKRLLDLKCFKVSWGISRQTKWFIQSSRSKNSEVKPTSIGQRWEKHELPPLKYFRYYVISRTRPRRSVCSRLKWPGPVSLLLDVSNVSTVRLRGNTSLQKSLDKLWYSHTKVVPFFYLFIFLKKASNHPKRSLVSQQLPIQSAR